MHKVYLEAEYHALHTIVCPTWNKNDTPWSAAENPNESTKLQHYFDMSLF